MAAKYDVDAKVNVEAKVTTVTSDEAGTIYQVKMVAQGKTITQYFREDELTAIEP